MTMDSSKCLLLMVLGCLVCIVGSSSAMEFSLAGLLTGGVSDDDDGPSDAIPCVKKLLPCKPYLHAPMNVPVSCCLPLKQMVTDDVKCLCGLFNNAGTLKKLNLTQDEALKLPKACGANADISLCKKDSTSPPKSPETPPTSNNSSTKKNAAASHFSGYGFATTFVVALIIAATAAS